MRNYKKLGKYIQEINIRNTDLKGEVLLGVSIRKVLMPSIANTIGADMSTYKLIKRNQFAYGPVTSRNGDKISVAKLDEFDNAIVSQAYTVFEVIDENELNPEYLMMWFRRPEFDRYARFKSHGSARETFDWNEMLETELPIPSIEKQRAIVKEYNVIQNRIALNQQLIQKLEETAQAICKQWFVDFEFPNENGLPYKSSGGEMVWNEELDKEIPMGWQLTNLGSISTIKAGGDKPQVFSENITATNKIPIYSNSSNNEGLFGYTNKAVIEKSSITISARGAIIGYTVLRTTPFVPIVRLIVVIPNEDYLLNYIYETIKDNKYDNSGSAQGQLTIPDVYSFEIMLPTNEVLKKYQKIALFISNMIEIKTKENQKLTELKDLLLSKLATVEDEKDE